MAASSGQVEGLKMLADWCKWLVTIETGAIALIGAVVSKDAGQLNLAAGVRTSAELTICFFVLSILVAMLLMSAIPTSFEDIEPGTPIWHRGVYAFVFRIGRIYQYAHFLGALFLLGIISFAVAVVQQLRQHS